MQRKKICRYFERGSCKKENCPFVHLRENRKNCNFYMEGHCRKGANCNFYHPPRQSQKIATLKEELKEKKKVKPVQKQSSEDEYQQYLEEVPIEKKQKQEVEQQVEKIEPPKQQQTAQIIPNISKQQKEIAIKQGKINFLLGLNEQEDSSSDEQIPVKEVVEPIQFVKTYPKRFPDLSRTAQMKAQILKNQQLLFKGEKYLSLITNIQDPVEKERLQIIRKFTDHYQQLTPEQPLHFSIRVRPLLFEKQIALHFLMLEDTVNLEISAINYPQERASFVITNPSIPAPYRIKLKEAIDRIHLKRSLFQALKYFQNNFEKVYEDCRFRLQNEHYSQKQLEKKMKQKQKEGQPQTQKIKIRRQKKPKKQKDNQNPDVRQHPYKEGQKLQNLFFPYQLIIEELLLHCQYAVTQKLLCYLECVCEKQFSYLFDLSRSGSLTQGVKLECKKCHTNISLGVQRRVLQGRGQLIAKLGINNGKILEIGGIGFKLGCKCNSQISRGRLYLPGERISVNCHHCFETLTAFFGGMKIFNPNLKGVQIKPDTELPSKGTCKHVKLSFRWFRYGCCGRCFSCDDCHIVASTWLHEKVKGITMLCGYCSFEQPISNDCVSCHKQLLKGVDKTGHWEGGMGCRDQTQLSRKDPKKYSGLTKHPREK